MKDVLISPLSVMIPARQIQVSVGMILTLHNGLQVMYAHLMEPVENHAVKMNGLERQAINMWELGFMILQQALTGDDYSSPNM